MNAQDLKNSILQLAVQGKLVEQRPEEGTAKDLLAQIKVEKEQLIKDKKIKKEKPLPEITDEEILFEIPESWEWVRLVDIINFKMGKTPPRGDETYWGNDCKWVSISDMIDGEVISDTKECVSNKAITEKFKEIVPKETMLMSFKLTVGKVSILGTDAVHNEAIISIYPYVDNNFILRDYLFKILPYMSVFGKTKKAIMGFTLNSDSLSRLLIPFPPLEEQKRIVAKIEEILPYIEQYDKAYTKLEAFNKKFPEDMKKSILQMAMQGKLVEQRPEEGTADELYEQIVAEKARLVKAGKIKKEKPLAEITDEECYLEIPETWKWCKLAEISCKITDGEHKTPRRVDCFCGYYLLSARNIRDGYISIDDVDYVDFDEYEKISKRCNPKQGDVLISCSGSVGRCAVVSDDFNYVMVRSAAMVSPIYIDSNYLMYALQSEYVQAQIRDRTKQAVQANLFQDAIRNLVIPLPPFAEQKRIVAKLEQMLPFCDQLIK